jgi:peptidyl-tRNA hydrolase, PTH1 family
MKLLVGLGNPGKKHLLQRHNLGFLMADAWVALNGERFQKREFQGETALVRKPFGDVLVLKPQTFMNRSGEALGEALRFHKAPIEEVVVLHDELDIPPQTFRLKRGGGHGGHNGLRSIGILGNDYLRVRLGIGRPPLPEMDVADFVLGQLSKAELGFWEKEAENIAAAIDLCLQGKVEAAMNQFHKKEARKSAASEGSS